MPLQATTALRTIRTVALLTVDCLLWSRRTLLVFALSIGVIGISVLGRLVLDSRWGQARFTAPELFGVLMSTAIVHFLVVFVALFYGTALISDEVEGKTLTYLFLRPIPKPILVAGKYTAMVWIGILVIVPAVLASFLVLYAGRDAQSFLAGAGLLGADLATVFLALLAYGAIFTLLGAWLRHSVLAGLLYAFGWEGIIAYLPGFTRKLTVTHYVQSIFPHEERTGPLQVVIGDRTPTLEAIVTLVLVALFFVALAGLVVREKEYVLDGK